MRTRRDEDSGLAKEGPGGLSRWAPTMTIPRRSWRLSLTQQILLGLALGCVLGLARPSWALHVEFLRDIFLNLIKSLIAPLIFSSVVAGIGGGGSARKVGRLGLKTLIYFEIATTLALAVGLAVANFAHPGRGVVLQAGPAGSAGPPSRPMTLSETLVHAFPSSIVEAMANGDVLQIVAFAVIFGLAVAAVGNGRGQ